MCNKLEHIQDLLKSCFVPELKQDLDSISLQSEHFQEYGQVLEHQLPILYDFVEQQKSWLFADAVSEALEVRSGLIVLLAEITAGGAPVYAIKNKKLLKHANQLLQKYHMQLENATVEQILFTHYQTKLHRDCWKRQLGSVHGFLRLLECRHNDATGNLFKMSAQWLTFCLSVGLTVRECHDPIYKQIGTRIFQLMLHHGSSEDIQNLNVHCVIYDAVYNDVHCMDSVVTTADIWSCLYKCLDHFQDIDSLSWNNVDDVMAALLRNISLASDSLISICLLKFITKLAVYFTINRQEIETKYSADLSQPDILERCRFACVENSSYTPFRWANSILNMFIIESYKLMQKPNVCRQFLQAMHTCYMASILPIPLPVVEPHLIIFFEKFTSILMEVIVVQKQDPDIVRLIKSVLETFNLQLLRSPYCENLPQLLKFREAFEKLLQHELFVQNK